MASFEQLIFGEDGYGPRTAKMYMIPLDADTFEPLAGFKPISLQYWPESMSLNVGSVGWQPRMIPGLSHPLFSWTSNDAPQLSFEIKLAADTDPAVMPPGNQKMNPNYEPERNVNINAMIAWMRAMMLPEYSTTFNGIGSVLSSGTASATTVKPPALIQIVPEYLPSDDINSDGITVGDVAAIASKVAGLGGEANGAKSGAANASLFRGTTLSNQADLDFYGLLSSMDVNYQEWFPSGAPKMATIQVSFFETIQLGDVIKPHGRSGTLEIASHYNLTDNSISFGAPKEPWQGVPFA